MSLIKAVTQAGGCAAVGRALGISRQSVWKWLEADRVPAERVLDLEAITGLPRHKLRPDLYPVERER